MAEVVAVNRRRWLRPVYFLAGSIFLALGVAGVFLPLVPTTGPLLLAAFCFARSSERIHRWLVEHPRFGRFISDFQSGHGIPLRTKIVAVTSMSLAFAYSIGWVMPTLIGKAAVGVVWAWAAWYVLHLPTAR
jgi:uncharacterized membrane protein YbaN (DUF454 family)